MDMKANEYIIDFLNELSQSFEVSFRYGYNTVTETHIVELSSVDVYNDINFGLKELDFSIRFRDLFGENILFISLNDVVQLNCVESCVSSFHKKDIPGETYNFPQTTSYSMDNEVANDCYSFAA